MEDLMAKIVKLHKDLYVCMEEENKRIHTAIHDYNARVDLRNEVIAHHPEFDRHSKLFDELARDDTLAVK